MFPEDAYFPIMAVAMLLGGCGAPEMPQRASRIETDPPSAAIYVDGGYVGKTPTAFHLPAKDKVQLRLELPGYSPQEDVLYRDSATPAGAPEGVGWEEVYWYPLPPRRD